jgi:hypothetical protein
MAPFFKLRTIFVGGFQCGGKLDAGNDTILADLKDMLQDDTALCQDWCLVRNSPAIK